MTPTEWDSENGKWIDVKTDTNLQTNEKCPTCHYPLRNGTLREENLKLRQDLDVVKETLKGLISVEKDGFIRGLEKCLEIAIGLGLPHCRALIEEEISRAKKESES